MPSCITEIGMVGREGLVGINVLLQADAPSYGHSVVQLPGVALRIPAPAPGPFSFNHGVPRASS